MGTALPLGLVICSDQKKVSSDKKKKRLFFAISFSGFLYYTSSWSTVLHVYSSVMDPPASFMIIFPRVCSKKNHSPLGELQIYLFLLPASLHGQNLCTTAPELGQGRAARFTQKDTPASLMRCQVGMVGPDLLSLHLLVWNLYPMNCLGQGQSGTNFLYLLCLR